MTTSCPYCNTVVAVPEPAPARVTCPRCGEGFPSGAASAAAGPASPVGPAPVKRANRRLGVAIVLGMLLLAGAVVAVLVNTRSKRGLETLAELDVLGYLPDDTNVIVGVNVPIAERSLDGKEPEGRKLLDQLGFADRGSFDPERYVGLPRGQIETAVVGLKVDSNLIPRVRVVVRTRSSYDPTALREKLAANRSKTEGTKTYDLVRPPGLASLEMGLWCATARTYVLCYPPDDLAKVPDEPAKDVDRLAAPVVRLLKERSDREDFVWLVAHSDNWEKTPLALVMPKLTPESRKMVFSVRTVGVGLRQDRGAVTTRSRPARITEEVKDEQRGVAADLVLLTAEDASPADLRNALEDRLEKLRDIDIKDSSLVENRYSVTLSAKAAEWERVLRQLREPAPK